MKLLPDKDDFGFCVWILEYDKLRETGGLYNADDDGDDDNH